MTIGIDSYYLHRNLGARYPTHRGPVLASQKACKYRFSLWTDQRGPCRSVLAKLLSCRLE